MSGKSQKIGDSTVSRPSQFCGLMITRNRRHPRSSGIVGDKSGAISAMVGDHSQHVKTPIRTVGGVGDIDDSFSSLPIL